MHVNADSVSGCQFFVPIDFTRLSIAKQQRERASLRAFMRVAAPPSYVYPEHLGPYLEVLERAAREPVRVVVSAPPRHTKTETTVFALVWLMVLYPGLKVLVVSYNDELAREISRRAKRIVEWAGLTFGDSNSANYWELPNGSSFSATGIGGTLTGKGFHLVVIDDPVKNREEAESQTYREKVYEAFIADIYTRRQPLTERPTSFIVIQTRWHQDDLAGRLISAGWPCINLPAIDDSGNALWPAGFSREQLDELETQLGPYNFAALYLGQPRPRGESVFGEPYYYDTLPKGGYRISIGADFAYTTKTHSDFSSAVVLYHAGGVSYVAEVYRERVRIEHFRSILAAMQARHPGKITAYVAATEEGSVEMLNSPLHGSTAHLRAESVRAVTDKFTRAQDVAAAWRAGKVLVPRSAPWLNAFLNEVTSFTGVKDRHDDQVDALCGAFHPFKGRPKTVYHYGNEHFIFG